MTFIVILCLLGLVAFLFLFFDWLPNLCGLEDTVLGVCICSWLVVACLIFTVGVNRMQMGGNFARIQSVRDSLATARAGDIDPFERAALQHTVVEMNQDIAAMQYWNRHYFDLWWPDTVDNIQPLH